MSYFKYGDVVTHKYNAGVYSGEWNVIATKDYLKVGGDPDCMVTVGNSTEIFSCDEQFLTLVRPTPEERAQEKLGEDYL